MTKRRGYFILDMFLIGFLIWSVEFNDGHWLFAFVSGMLFIQLVGDFFDWFLRRS